MELDLTPEQEGELTQLASYSGAQSEELVKNAVLRLLAEQARFRAAVREGIDQADRGEFIEEDAMDQLLEDMLRT